MAAGIDAVALKPAECDVSRVTLPDAVETVTIDYEGHEHVPDVDALTRLAANHEVRVTTPVRADGFDPFGDDSITAALPENVGRVVVAGHAAYLDEHEAARAIAPRLGAAVDADPDAWVGTEGVERAALATGATQFELLSRTTETDVKALRAAGFDGGIAVYAPTVFASSEDAILDSVGGYTARRTPVRRALPEDAATDGGASGRARDVLSAAVRDYALVGEAREIQERVTALREAGADRVVAYPAGGVEGFLA